ncbi:unnamed protein product [Mytilus edulis]|uniref:Uncharacterized protein n=1 Tax=Mytilus edulis TaxID=6550 RepID=A0A8S3UB43_MYTED|nr:unnamed protein product [Mytilus edulis]
MRLSHGSPPSVTTFGTAPDKLMVILINLKRHEEACFVIFRIGTPFQEDCDTMWTPPLSPDDIRKKKWLKQDSQAYAALEKVVTDKLILRDIRQLDLFCHTGALETYHSMMLKYCPKRLEFEYASMVARTQLAVVDNNVNIGRNQKTDANGKLSFATRCPKSTGRWTARKIYEKKDYDFKSDRGLRNFVLAH